MRRGESWRLEVQVKKVGEDGHEGRELERNEGAPGAGRGALWVVKMVVREQAEQVWAQVPSNSGRTERDSGAVSQHPGVRLATTAAVSSFRGVGPAAWS